MLKFLKNFTDDLNRRFTTTALDVAPQEFDNQRVLIVSDIENPTIEEVRVAYRLFSYLVVNGQSDYWVYALAETPGISPATTQVGGWYYDLTKLKTVDLNAVVMHGRITMGGGTGNISFEKFIRGTGSTAQPNFPDHIYSVTTSRAATTGTVSLVVRDDVKKRIYTGQTILASGNLSFPNGPGSPIFLLPGLNINVPNTMPDVIIDDLWLEFHFTIEYLKQTRTVQDIPILPV